MNAESLLNIDDTLLYESIGAIRNFVHYTVSEICEARLGRACAITVGITGLLLRFPKRLMRLILLANFRQGLFFCMN